MHASLAEQAIFIVSGAAKRHASYPENRAPCMHASLAEQAIFIVWHSKRHAS